MSRSTQIIQESLEWAAKHYQILTTSCSYSYEKGNLIGVNAIGAVMVKYEKSPTTIPLAESAKDIAEKFPYPGWLKDCCDILGEDTYWIWRFSKGFDQGIVLKIIDEKDKEHLDDVSDFGNKLRKQYVEKP